MQLFAQELFRKFHELPENLTPKHYRFFVFTNYAFFMAAIFHFVFILVFALLGLKILVIYNIFSSFVWALLIYLNLKGLKVMPLVLANIEVWIHAGLCAVFIGWNSGFHYYILAIPLVLFLSLRPMIFKILICLLNGITYVLLNYYTNISSPIASIDSNYLNWLNYTRTGFKTS